MTAYHVTPDYCVDGIQANGLQVCDTTKAGHYADMADIVAANAGVEAVYVWQCREQAECWAEIETCTLGPSTIVEVNIDGLPTEPDPELSEYAGWDSALRVLVNIPTGRIVRFHA
jgi:hypothetical protein